MGAVPHSEPASGFVNQFVTDDVQTGNTEWLLQCDTTAYIVFEWVMPEATANGPPGPVSPPAMSANLKVDGYTYGYGANATYCPPSGEVQVTTSSIDGSPYLANFRWGPHGTPLPTPPPYGNDPAPFSGAVSGFYSQRKTWQLPCDTSTYLVLEWMCGLDSGTEVSVGGKKLVELRHDTSHDCTASGVVEVAYVPSDSTLQFMNFTWAPSGAPQPTPAAASAAYSGIVNKMSNESETWSIPCNTSSYMVFETNFVANTGILSNVDYSFPDASTDYGRWNIVVVSCPSAGHLTAKAKVEDEMMVLNMRWAQYGAPLPTPPPYGNDPAPFSGAVSMMYDVDRSWSFPCNASTYMMVRNGIYYGRKDMYIATPHTQSHIGEVDGVSWYAAMCPASGVVEVKPYPGRIPYFADFSWAPYGASSWVAPPPYGNDPDPFSGIVSGLFKESRAWQLPCNTSSYVVFEWLGDVKNPGHDGMSLTVGENNIQLQYGPPSYQAYCPANGSVAVTYSTTVSPANPWGHLVHFRWAPAGAPMPTDSSMQVSSLSRDVNGFYDKGAQWDLPCNTSTHMIMDLASGKNLAVSSAGNWGDRSVPLVSGRNAVPCPESWVKVSLDISGLVNFSWAPYGTPLPTPPPVSDPTPFSGIVNMFYTESETWELPCDTSSYVMIACRQGCDTLSLNGSQISFDTAGYPPHRVPSPLECPADGSVEVTSPATGVPRLVDFSWAPDGAPLPVPEQSTSVPATFVPTPAPAAPSVSTSAPATGTPLQPTTSVPATSAPSPSSSSDSTVPIICGVAAAVLVVAAAVAFWLCRRQASRKLKGVEEVEAAVGAEDHSCELLN